MAVERKSLGRWLSRGAHFVDMHRFGIVSLRHLVHQETHMTLFRHALEYLLALLQPPVLLALNHIHEDKCIKRKRKKRLDQTSCLLKAMPITIVNIMPTISVNIPNSCHELHTPVLHTKQSLQNVHLLVLNPEPSTCKGLQDAKTL